MGSINKVIIIGRLTKDPIIRTFENGGKIALFDVAINEKYYDKNTNEKKEKTQFHKVRINKPSLMNFVENYLKKGHLVYVEGKLETKSYKDRFENNAYITEIILQSFDHNLQLLNVAKNDKIQKDTKYIEK